MKQHYDPDGLVMLFSAVCRQVLNDARRGNLHAQGWLDDMLPEWRTMERAHKRRELRPRKPYRRRQQQ